MFAKSSKQIAARIQICKIAIRYEFLILMKMKIHDENSKDFKGGTCSPYIRLFF